MTQREGHGWWPYLVPLFSFLLVLEIAGRAGDVLPGLFLAVKVALPAGFFLYFLRRGDYPELSGYPDRPGAIALDALVGVVGGLVWMAPYVVLEWAKPEFVASWPEWSLPQPEDAFDPDMLGPTLAGVALSLRCIGYGLVTPFVEELFVRSFLTRYGAVFDTVRDFRDVAIGTYTRRSFWIVVVFFTLSHVRWEWPVAILWIVGTQLWYYHRKHVGALVVVHAGSNLSIFLAAWATSGLLVDRHGAPMDLWFFV